MTTNHSIKTAVDGDSPVEIAALEEGPIALTEVEAWAAVEGRDRRFDGAFVYAVKTTGIYCRPSCAARRPLRQNVVYYASPEAAEEAGYRACRRCNPANPQGTIAEQTVERARTYIDVHLDEQITLQMLADEVNMSATHLQRTFKRFVGISPKAYQDARRLEVYKETVREEGDVLSAAFGAGFGSSRALYALSENGLGMTPGAYRRGADGLVIQFTTVASAFGRLLVAVTGQGVCAVSLGDDDAALVAALEEEFPNATSIERNDEALQTWVEPMVRYLDGVHAHPTVPLDLQGTDFQRRVWKRCSRSRMVKQRRTAR